ncbi:hypothetical protein [Xanthomonas albilineans]|uniref:hypothetical protein n=1 Tax=Xanthomonas albilineans TaxID=29447 RepID=UPI0012D3EABA|nr:hypothetical protein [Xanthomonas albilineans]
MNHSNKPTPISADDLLAFMKAKNVNLQCPRCPATDWQMVESEESRGVALPVLGDDGVTKSDILPIMPIVCRNCGFVWAVARQRVQEWMEEKNPGSNNG